MKRTKKWWSGLNRAETSRLWMLERACNNSATQSYHYRPRCLGCHPNYPNSNSGICDSCQAEIELLIAKGNNNRRQTAGGEE